MAAWDPALPGVLTLPSGRLVRGRSLRVPVDLAPDFGLHLSGGPPPSRPWPSRCIRWRDFGLPRDPADAEGAIREAYERCEAERVLVGCAGGVGRTGTVLACLAVLDGVPAGEAVAYVREHYHRRAVETRTQERYVRAFGVR